MMRKISARNVATPDIVFNNRGFDVDVRTVSSPGGFDLKTTALFKNASDARVNGYSAMVLSDKALISDLLHEAPPNDFALAYANTDPKKFIYHTTYLKVGDLYLRALPDNVSGTVTFGFSETYDVNCIFTLEFRASDAVGISFDFNNSKFYVKEDGSSSPVFWKYIPVWNKESGKILLITVGYDGYHVSFPDYATGVQQGFILNPPQEGETPFNPTAVISTRLFADDTFVPLTEQRWHSFIADETRGNKRPDTVKSYTDVKTSFVSHFQYPLMSDTLELNVLHTKDFLTRNNFQNRGGVVFSEDVNSEIDHRTYSSLFTGNSENGGYESPVLSYVGFGFDILIRQDSSYVFTMPTTMRPYTRVNVNDISLFDCGAHGSTSPILSDKLYKKLVSFDDSFPITGYETGQYLCTWLYVDPNTGAGTWVDRWYSPESTTLMNAISTAPSAGVVITQMETNSTASEEFADKIAEDGFCDVRSNLTFEPLAQYEYQRLGADFYGKYFKSKAASLLTTVPDIIFDGKTVTEVQTQSFGRNIDAFTLSFFLDANQWQKAKGSTFFSCKNGDGFSLSNDVFQTPYIITAFPDRVEIRNTKLTPAKTITSGSYGETSQIVSVYYHGAGDTMLIVHSDGTLRKVSVEGAVREGGSIPLDAGEIPACVHFVRDTYRIEIFTGTRVFTLDWRTLELISISESTVRGKLTSITGSEYTLDGSDILLDGTSVFNAPGIDRIKTDSNGNLLIGLDTTVLIFDKDRRFSGKVILAADKVITFDSSLIGEENFIYSLTTKDGFSYVTKVSYDGTVVSSEVIQADTVSPPIRCPLSFSTEVRNYYGTVSRTALIFDYSIPAKGSDGAIVGQMVYDAKNLANGVHHIAIRFDSIAGKLDWFLNGRIIARNTFTNGLYGFFEGFINNLVFGAPLFGTDSKLKTAVDDSSFITINNTSLLGFRIYGIPMNDADVRRLPVERFGLQDVVFTFPFGARNESDTIKTVYRMGIPARKDNKLSITLSGVESINRLDEMMQSVREVLNKENPVTTDMEYNTR